MSFFSSFAPTVFWLLGETEIELPLDPTFWPQFFRMLAVLSGVIALLVGTTWYLKKMMGQRQITINASHKIKVLEKRSLSQKGTLYLVEVEGTGHLLADSPAGITSIAKVSLTPSEVLPDSPPTSFKEKLQKKLMLAQLKPAQHLPKSGQPQFKSGQQGNDTKIT